MNPIPFKEQTKVLKKPSDMSDKECCSMPVWNDGLVSISCWKMSLVERFKAFFLGKIWVRVRSGETQPPICVEVGSPFIKGEK